jgi:antitoxin (DNA-binding transcriptional repressor) of toxin-antitoxin stability system
MTNAATATEFNREPSKFLRDARRGVTTEVTSHGQTTAALIPQPGITSGAELARKLSKMKPQPDAAAAVESIIQRLDEAD